MASIVNRETDTRFWAQTGYKPGKRLKKDDPKDAAMMPVWDAVRDKVLAEFRAGTLVTTYDHPIVSPALADAAAASAAAEGHIDAAKEAPHPAAAAHHEQAAADAVQAAADAAQAAAAVQPPSTSQELVEEAASRVAAEPPHPAAPASEHVAHAQALAAPRPTPRSIIDHETDARFWAQTGYRPGHALELSDATDRSMMPVWRAIREAVLREDARGRLVVTYAHPEVARGLNDARVADRAAAGYLEVARSGADASAAARQAELATQISRARAVAAADRQPPSVSPDIVAAASRFANGAREDLGASAQEHLAKMQAQRAAHHAAAVHHHHRRRRHPPRSAVSPQSLHAYRSMASRHAHRGGGPAVVTVRPDGSLEHRPVGSRAELDATYARESADHDAHRYVGAFDPTAGPAPVHESVGVPAAEVTPAPAEAAHEVEPVAAEPAPRRSGWKVGLALAGAAAVAGGIFFYKRSSGGSKRYRLPPEQVQRVPRFVKPEPK